MTQPGGIALTYSRGRLRGLGARLRRDGRRVIRRPLLETVSEPSPCSSELRRLLACPWVLFASPAAVRAWEQWGLGFADRLVGATGPGTAHLLAGLGADVQVIGDPADAGGLACGFLQHPLASGPVALPRGDRALPTLPLLLGDAGIETVEVTAYTTSLKPWNPRELPAAVVVGSPSALLALGTDVRQGSTIVAIGATTAGAAARHGCRHVVQAEQPTVEGVYRALEQLNSTTGEAQ